MDDKETKIAVFKYGLIAPLVVDGQMSRKEHFHKLAGMEHDFPGLGKRKYSPAAFKKWYIKYRKYGLDGLKPSFRKDKGLSRSISPDVQQAIASFLKDFRFRTVRNLYDLLTDRALIGPGKVSYATLNNYVRRNGLFAAHREIQPRKAFEAEHVNQLWLVDFMYGPYVREGRNKPRSYLCAIIDDHSRFIVSAAFYISQSNISFHDTLKKAIAAYGLPNKLYCDNGKVFVDDQITIISARLGFLVVHSQPHDSPSRGKIERFFRTVRDCFIPHLYIQFQNGPFTLDQINQAFAEWLSAKYNRKTHSVIKAAPFDRYFAGRDKIKIRKIVPHILIAAFLHTEHRQVNNDSTISFASTLYEVPGRYCGQKIQLRYDPFNQHELFLYEKDQCVCKLKKLDKHFNARFPINFNTPEEK